MSGEARAHRPDWRATLSLARLPALIFAFVITAGIVPQPASGQTSELPAPASSLQPLLDFKDSDIKFQLRSLMNILRDRDHEGWVLAAYPDPSTGKPLIGAGFSLEVAATDHPQSDSHNPNLFLEPSSTQLWEAAGLDPDRLQPILDRFNRDLDVWTKKSYGRRVKANALRPELTYEEATSLLRISTIQAIHNARAYCREFDQLTASQQMALSQLVFQMGVNLEEFVDFRAAINGYATDPDVPELVLPSDSSESASEHWNAVRQTLIDSQWAKRYTIRATTVIAMFDTDYARDPGAAELRVAAVLRPPATRQHKNKKASATLRAANEGKKVPGAQSKRKVT
jgi:hypothetical protein